MGFCGIRIILTFRRRIKARSLPRSGGAIDRGNLLRSHCRLGAKGELAIITCEHRGFGPESLLVVRCQHRRLRTQNPGLVPRQHRSFRTKRQLLVPRQHRSFRANRQQLLCCRACAGKRYPGLRPQLASNCHKLIHHLLGRSKSLFGLLCECAQNKCLERPCKIGPALDGSLWRIANNAAQQLKERGPGKRHRTCECFVEHRADGV